MIRVSLLIPGTVLRRGLMEVLREFPFVELIDPAAPLQQDDFAPFEADVVIVAGTETTGERLAEILADRTNPPAVLVLGDDPALVQGWARLPFRAVGALPAAADEGELEAAINALGRGLSVWHPHFDAASLRSTAPRDGATGTGIPEEIETLTGRELEVLQLLALGSANKQIAYKLKISEHTVKYHISAIYGKLGAGNRTEAVRIGLQVGLITL